MLFVVVDGCKMLHNSSFDSMSHVVQDEFQSTNSEDKFKHIQYMSKKHTLWGVEIVKDVTVVA